MPGDWVAGEVALPGGGPAVIKTYFDAINAEDFELLATVWSDEIEIRAVGARPRHGRDDVMDYYSGIFAPWKQHFDGPIRTLFAEKLAVVEIVFTGESTGEKKIEFPAVDVFELEDGKIRTLTIWYDLLWVRKQLA